MRACGCFRLTHSWQSLYELALAGDLKAVTEFLDLNPSTNLEELDEFQDETSRTPLMAAAMRGHMQVVEVLLQRKANPNTKNAEGATALSYAAVFQGTDLCSVLIKHGADVKLAARGLCDAAYRGKFDVCQFLLQSNADPNARSPDDYTPLCCAAERGHLSVCQLLVEHRADPKAKIGKSFDTALSKALDKKHADVAAFLRPLTVWHGVRALLCVSCVLCLMARLFVQVKPQSDIMKTAGSGDMKQLEQAIKAGGDVNEKHTNDMTPLMYAAFFGHQAALELLLEHKADPNLVGIDSIDQSEKFALFFAARAGYKGCCEALLKARADPAMLHDGKPLARIARKEGHTDLAAFLDAWGKVRTVVCL